MRFLSLGIAAALIAGPAAAVMTHKGEGQYPLPGTTAAAQPALAGTVIKDDLVPFVITALNSGKLDGTVVGHGTVQVRVVKTKDGTLTFYWKINNAADSKKPLGMFLVTFVPDREYDANWRIDGLGSVAPDKLNVVKYPNGQFEYRFMFDKQAIAPGQSSRFFFIKSTATKTGKATIAPLATDNSGSTTAVAAVAPAF